MNDEVSRKNVLITALIGFVIANETTSIIPSNHALILSRG